MNIRDILMSGDPVAALTVLDVSGELGNLEPSLAALRMSIPDGFHHKDNLTHSLQVLANAIAREPDGADLVLRTAALFHDIGKPATRKFGDGGSVTFDGHEPVGAHMVRRILPKHGYSEDETDEVAILVAYHMRSHGFTSEKWTDSGIRRLAAEAGSDETLNRLVIIFYADVTSKIPGKVESLHAVVDTLVSAIADVRAKDARAALRPALDGTAVMELFGIPAGPELGAVMRYLNSDEGIALSRDEAITAIRTQFVH